MQANFQRMRFQDSNHGNGQQGKTCYSCGKEGHMSFNCDKNQNNNVNQQNGYNNYGGQNSERRWCNYCKSSTHTEKSCHKKKRFGHQAKQARESENDKHTFDFNFCIKNDILPTSNKDSDDFDSAKYVSDAVIKGSLLVDTGATSHIVTEDNFVDVDDSYVPENHYIELADGSRTNSVAKKR